MHLVLTAQQTAELDAWLNQYTSAANKADSGTAAAVWAAYASVNDWFDPKQTVEAAKAAAGAMQTAQRTHAGLMAEFLELSTHIMTGRRPTSPSGLGAVYPRNADPFDVYSRPVFEYRDQIAKGLDDTLAEQAAKLYAEVLAETDAALARRDAAQTVLDAGQITEYRRIIRPELSKTGTCGMCIAASTQIYKTDNLMALHSRCKCVPMPVIGSKDPDGFNRDDLEALYKANPATDRQALAATRYKVGENGELGPVLEPEAKQAVPRVALDGPTPTPEAAPKASGGSGGAKPPKKPPVPSDAFGPEPKDPKSPEGLAYWAKRREALGIDFGADANQIDPPEIKTAERLLERGGQLAYIPRKQVDGQWVPTSDFLWTPKGEAQGLPIEIKSLLDGTGLAPATFPRRIKKAVGKSLQHGEQYRKRNFVLDAGDRVITAGVRRALRRYNLDNPDRAVDQIWLLSRGTFEQIVLDK